MFSETNIPHLNKIKKDNYFYLINNKTKQEVFGPCKFISMFFAGRCMVQDTVTEKWGYIDPLCNLIIKYNFDNCGPFDKSGIAHVVYDKEWSKIDRDGIPFGPVKEEYEKKKKFPYEIGDFVRFVYKDEIAKGKLVKVNNEKETFTVEMEDGRKVWRYWKMLH